MTEWNHPRPKNLDDVETRLDLLAYVAECTDPAHAANGATHAYVALSLESICTDSCMRVA
jgi:hypothetical protein